MVEKLKSPKPSKIKGSHSGRMLWFLSMRFRFNSHRKIRSYIIETDMPLQDLWQCDPSILEKTLINKKTPKIKIETFLFYDRN